MEDQIDFLFTYQVPDDDQVHRMNLIREKAKDLAKCIDTNVPPGADRTDAIRKLMECVNTANRGVTLKGQSYR